MPTRKSPRKGSLQFWPRKRVAKLLPRVNWNPIDSEKNVKGFICYKAGMVSVSVKDNTSDSMTKGKNIVRPATIIVCPKMKIFSVRFYKYGKTKNEILAEQLEKKIKRKIKLKKKKKKIEEVKDFDDLRIVFYSVVKQTGIKKKPDMVEVGLSGNAEDKVNFVKENINKEFSVSDFFEKGQLVDFRGVTKGKGLQGPVKRFGVTLRPHKSEKGIRKVGSIGPWHPARVTFRVPMAGQMGMFTRISYNKKIIEIKKQGENEIKNIKNFGNTKTDYMIVEGSVQGPAKRALVITAPLRETKKQKKKSYDFLEVLK